MLSHQSPSSTVLSQIRAIRIFSSACVSIFAWANPLERDTKNTRSDNSTFFMGNFLTAITIGRESTGSQTETCNIIDYQPSI
jgi:hypothetical protein